MNEREIDNEAIDQLINKAIQLWVEKNPEKVMELDRKGEELVRRREEISQSYPDGKIDELTNRRLIKEVFEENKKERNEDDGGVIVLEEFKIKKSTKMVARAFIEGRYDLDDDT